MENMKENDILCRLKNILTIISVLNLIKSSLPNSISFEANEVDDILNDLQIIYQIILNFIHKKNENIYNIYINVFWLINELQPKIKKLKSQMPIQINDPKKLTPTEIIEIVQELTNIVCIRTTPLTHI